MNNTQSLMDWMARDWRQELRPMFEPDRQADDNEASKERNLAVAAPEDEDEDEDNPFNPVNAGFEDDENVVTPEQENAYNK